MAFPTIVNSATTMDDVNGTSTTANLPSNIVSGNLLLMHFGAGLNTTDITATGWTVLSTGVTGGQNWWLARVADGSEGSTVTVSYSNSGDAAAICYQISNWEGTLSGVTASHAASNGVDPPSLSPSWGAEDTLWFAGFYNEQIEVTGFTAPANYSGLISQDSADFTSTNASRCQVATAHRTLNAATEDPGVWTLTGSTNDPEASTVAVRPATAYGVTVTGIKEPNESDALVTGVTNARVLAWYNAAYGDAPDADLTAQEISAGEMTVELSNSTLSDTATLVVSWDAGGGETKFFRTTDTIVDLDA